MIVFLEGMPGSGKSTTSGMLFRNLERNGISTKWIHELNRLHPVLFFAEASLTKREYKQWCEKYDEKRVMDSIVKKYQKMIGIDLLTVKWHYQEFFTEEAIEKLQEKDVWNFSLSEYINVALDKWRTFAEEAVKQPEKVYLLDSCIFQYQIFTFQLVEATKEELSSFINEIWKIVQPLQPHLIYLYRESVEEQFAFIKKVRGDWFFQTIWERDRHNPYYSHRPYGVEAYYDFLRDYDENARLLFKEASCPKLSLEISPMEWEKYQSSIFQFLKLTEIPEPLLTIPIKGKFINHELDLTIKIEETVDGYKLIDPKGFPHQISARSDNEWYIQDIPVMFHLSNGDDIIIGGENLIDRWTETGLTFKRVRKA